MTWSAYLIKTTTGQIGPKLDVQTASWSISLNTIETLQIDIKKASLPTGLDFSLWLAPWWAGVLLMYDNTPVFAGPIVSRPNEDFFNLSLSCSGIRSILMKRFETQEMIDWSGLAKTTIAYHGMSLGTIAKNIVKSVQLKPGGALPIAYPVPDELHTDDADHQRTYQGFNVQNLNADALLTELSGVHLGPDVMFKPRIQNGNQVIWDMWTGTEAQPRIYQAQTNIWDTTPVKGSVSQLAIVSTGNYLTNRVYSLGAGTDQGTLITVSQDLSSIPQGFPLLETSVNAAVQSTDKSVVQRQGDGSLAANLDILRELTLEVDITGVYPISTFYPGDLVRIVTKGWVTLKDGVHDCRLLNMTGDLTTIARLSMQTEGYNGSS